MTEQQIKDWEVERDIARKSGDPELVQKAYDHKDEMLMRCIAHQSDRVKSIKTDIETVKGTVSSLKTVIGGVQEDLKPCMESDKEFRAQKERLKGAKMALSILKWIVVAGGGATVMKLIESFPG